ncbi:MAG: 3-keto-5-aminohexanoate cleavage protein [Thermodesulfobacteriota bacterium]
MSKAIITAAVTGGIHTPSMSPHLALTPEQIADDAVKAAEAGAAVVHVHARNPENGMPSADQDHFRQIITGIKKRSNVVICITTGGGIGQTTEQRVSAVRNFSPELASLNGGSLNFALFQLLDQMKTFTFDWEPQYLAATEDHIFPNTFKTLREFSGYFREQNTKPEFEIYDVGMINNLAFMIQRGHIDRPVYLQFVLGILGGLPATMKNLMFLYDTAKEQIGDFQWSVCAAGRFQFPLCTTGLLLGGHARVGMEDNLYVEKGVLATGSADQVKKIIRIARELGREPATPEEARQILGLKGLDLVNY